MKKIATVLTTALIIALFATTAFASPGGPRGDKRFDARKADRVVIQKHDTRHVTHYKAPYKKQVVVMRREPVRTVTRVVYVTHPPVPVVTWVFPTVTIQIR